jgi:hypothetical protein
MKGHFSFSEPLIAEITAYYRERCGVLLSPEQAEQYLDSLADLYRCFQRSISEEAAPRAGARERPHDRHETEETTG